ncbi:MAG: hypothetical protein DLM67_16445 [Candidatus Nephthysia bennettiae]|nr:MAG: hypothetical protein DLM67_16445 [Candidatus Dormibacteraeota bacterium]
METVETGMTLMETSEWAALAAHYKEVGDQQLRDLFEGDPERGAELKAEADGFYLEPELQHDSSTNRLLGRYREMRETTPVGKTR